MFRRPHTEGEPAPPTALVVTRPQDNLRGAAIYLAATMVFTFEGVILRWTSQIAPVWQTVFLRALAQMALVLAICWLRGHVPRIEPGRVRLHLARAYGSLGNWTMSYYMYQKLDLALATVFSFASSLFVVILARPVLGEKVPLASWIATMLGFVGVAVAAGVGVTAFEPAVLFGLGSACAGALVVFLNRSMSQSDASLTIMTWVSVVIAVSTAPMALLHWTPISLFALCVMLLSGVASALGMFLSLEAYARAEAAFLAPVGYVRLVMAAAAGYAIFGEVPTLRMLAGALIVVVATLYVTRSEYLRRRRA